MLEHFEIFNAKEQEPVYQTWAKQSEMKIDTGISLFKFIKNEKGAT